MRQNDTDAEIKSKRTTLLCRVYGLNSSKNYREYQDIQHRRFRAKRILKAGTATLKDEPFKWSVVLICELLGTGRRCSAGYILSPGTTLELTIPVHICNPAGCDVEISRWKREPVNIDLVCGYFSALIPFQMFEPPTEFWVKQRLLENALPGFVVLFTSSSEKQFCVRRVFMRMLRCIPTGWALFALPTLK